MRQRLPRRCKRSLTGSFVKREKIISAQKAQYISLDRLLKKFEHVSLQMPKIAKKYFKKCPFQHGIPWCSLSNKPASFCFCKYCSKLNLIWKISNDCNFCLIDEWENLKEKSTCVKKDENK